MTRIKNPIILFLLCLCTVLVIEIAMIKTEIKSIKQQLGENNVTAIQAQLNKVDLMASNIFSEKYNCVIDATVKRRKPLRQKTKDLEGAISWNKNSQASN